MSLPVVSSIAETRKSVLEMASSKAKTFFLKGVSYCNLDFPPYVQFDNLLASINAFFADKDIIDVKHKNTIRKLEGVNHTLLTNKDGKYAWRPIELIHPALYISLLHKITNSDNWQTILARFSEFSGNEKIQCLSLPVESGTNETDKAEQVTQWWHEVEQKSVELALDYSYLIRTDISDCYGSIYTHSIVWAIHGKVAGKEKRKDKTLVGNQIDWHIQDMQNGQTNGIPQGSVLMDFIAEMVLGYADLQLSSLIEKTVITDYQILRYRDDYRIFVNNPQDAEIIVKLLTEILIELGLKINPSKTSLSSQVIRDSIKGDKLSWIIRHKYDRSLFKQLLIIHDHATEYPNSGSLVRALSDYHQRLSKHKSINEPVLPLFATTVDIGYSNPKTYPVISAILSILIEHIEDPVEKVELIARARKRFARIPNTGYLDIWLQRFTIHIDRDISYDEPLCKLIHGDHPDIWNSDWISSIELKNLVQPSYIVDAASVPATSEVITPAEIALFIANTSGQFSG